MKKYENFVQRCLGLLTCCLSLSMPTLQAATNWYQPEQLTVLAEQWMEQTQGSSDREISIQVTPLDNRIGAKECAHEPLFSLPANANIRQTTVQISCQAPQSWQLFVPVRLTEWLELVVIRQNIPPGTAITADMLDIQRRERRLVRGSIVTDLDLIVGSRNKRSLSVGQIINLQDLCLVCRGDVVTIEINHSGLAVTATGIAQQDGSLGDMIQVRNQQSGRNIATQVTGVNQVQVKF